jgi:predicted enzyme related to lactoylglutathione lyase
VVNTVGVADVDQAQRAAEKNGGTTVVPKMAVPGVGWLVYCTDPEGNTFGMMQNDPNAK